MLRDLHNKTPNLTKNKLRKETYIIWENNFGTFDISPR